MHNKPISDCKRIINFLMNFLSTYNWNKNNCNKFYSCILAWVSCNNFFKITAIFLSRRKTIQNVKRWNFSGGLEGLEPVVSQVRPLKSLQIQFLQHVVRSLFDSSPIPPFYLSLQRSLPILWFIWLDLLKSFYLEFDFRGVNILENLLEQFSILKWVSLPSII